MCRERSKCILIIVLFILGNMNYAKHHGNCLYVGFSQAGQAVRLLLAFYSALNLAKWPWEVSLCSLHLCNDTGKRRCQPSNNSSSTGKKFHTQKKEIFLALAAHKLNIGWQQCGRAKGSRSSLMREKWQCGDWQRDMPKPLEKLIQDVTQNKYSGL